MMLMMAMMLMMWAMVRRGLADMLENHGGHGTADVWAHRGGDTDTDTKRRNRTGRPTDVYVVALTGPGADTGAQTRARGHMDVRRQGATRLWTWTSGRADTVRTTQKVDMDIDEETCTRGRSKAHRPPNVVTATHRTGTRNSVLCHRLLPGVAYCVDRACPSSCNTI